MEQPNTRLPGATLWVSLFALLLATFMGFLDLFIVNVAAPSIQAQLHAQFTQLQFVLSGYILAYAVGLVLGGRLGDLYGRKRLFLIGVVAFALTSTACALSPTAGWLIVSRVLQGLSGALMLPQVLSTIQVIFPSELKPKAISFYGGVIGLASAIGQLVGGVIIQLNLVGLSWRPIFLVNVPIAIVAFVLAAAYIPETKNPVRTRLDVGGAVILAVSLSLLLYPLIASSGAGWSLWSTGMVALALAGLAGFLAYERARDVPDKSPLVRLSLLRQAPFAVGLLAVLLFYAGNSGFFFVLAYYLQSGLHFNALQSGLGFLPLGLGFMLSSLSSSSLVKRYGIRVLLAGTAAIALSFIIGIATVTQASLHGVAQTLLALTPFLFISGAGEGLVAAPLIASILAGVDPVDAGSASGTLLTMTQIANVTSVAVVGSLFTLFLAAVRSYQVAFVQVQGLLLALSVATALCLWQLGRVTQRAASGGK